MRLILIYIFIFISTMVHGQSMFTGSVTDSRSVPLTGVAIVANDLQKGTLTDVNGKFSLALPMGDHAITFQFIGYKTYHTIISIKRGGATLDVVMDEEVDMLNEVVVTGKSELTETKEQPFTVSTLDVEPLKVSDLNINQILNTTTGVRIREDGGLGSDFNFSLNGFSGSQVKFFIDGMPMDYFGSSLTLNNIPVNLISGIEVYKGVVPIHLGSDALGGAINILTNRSVRDYLNLSYSIGSFNTHKASLVGRLVSSGGLVTNLNAFYNYSDNNYDILADVVDVSTGKVKQDEVERFHDAYVSKTIQLETGVQNKTYADQLMLGIIASENEKELQSGFNLVRVVGEAFTTDKVLIPTLKYSKEELLGTKLDVRLQASYKIGQSMRVDTSSRQYNWYGEYTEKELDVRSGEISWDKTLFKFDDHALAASALLSVVLAEGHRLTVNNTYSRYRRVGSDPISYNAVPFSEPNYLTKNIAGVSYQIDMLQGALRHILFGKALYMNALLMTGEGVGNNDKLLEINNREMYPGYGLASTYFMNEHLQFKASYEHTYRLPEVLELFGDGLQRLPNAGLQAEKSQNFNLSIINKLGTGASRWHIECSYLYRLPESLIRNVALGQTSQYENLQSARSSIVEGLIKYHYSNKLQLEVNASYQSIVNNQKYTATGAENHLYRDRLPNMPFLFGNANLNWTIHNVGGRSNRLNFTWATQYVEAFYLKWPSQGSRESKYDIPRQLSHDISGAYSIGDGRYNMSVTCSNLFDSMLFDNFRLQKPGRAYALKLSYYIQQ